VVGNTPEGLLNIPEQTRPTVNSFNTRPKHVEAWVAALPMANIGESARRVYRALREINRLAISEHDRFQAMETFRSPVYHITEALKKYYINQHLPLSPKNQKIAELAIQLNAEMALGYKSVIEDKLSKTFSRLSTKTLTTSIHRAIRYLSNVLLCAYQIYIQHPQNTWLQIHRLYLFAEENNYHNSFVKDHVVTEALLDSSISDIYKQTLLLALAGPYRLRQSVTGAVHKALEDWSAQCRILPYGETTEGSSSFILNLNSDAAPGFFRSDNTIDATFCRIIDTTQMTRVISSTILPNGSGITGIPEDDLKRLLVAWTGTSRRTFSRTTKIDEIALTLGLSATHHYIDEIIRPLNRNSATTCAGATDSLHANDDNDRDEDEPELDMPAHYTSTPVFGISNLDDHTPDVWDPDYTYRATNTTLELVPHDSDNQKRKELLYQPFGCKGINESAGGYCLLGYLEYDTNTRKVQIGEIVGIRDAASNDPIQLGIGVIRRIKSWNNGLELGIQKLAPCAEAIATAAMPKDGGREKYHRSLALPELTSINQAPTLITHAWNQVGNRLIANVHGHKVLIELTKQLESTGVFSQFEFSVVETTASKPSTPAPESSDEFESVWSLL
jgi:hypothetical protein